jgi:hypothetical protein
MSQRCAANPGTLENRTLMRIARAIQERRADFDDSDISLPHAVLHSKEGKAWADCLGRH